MAATTAVIIIGGTAASNIGADAAPVSTITRDTGWKNTALASTYTGTYEVLTFQLAVGVNADNIRRCFDILADIRYDGVVSIECEGQGGPMIEKSLAWVRELVDETNKRM